jgi:hypothetical protein
MNPDRAFAGFIAAAVPLAAVIYALVMTGVIAIRKPPEPPPPQPPKRKPPVPKRKRLPPQKRH